MAIPQAVVAMSNAERSVVPATRGLGAAADIVILHSPADFGQSFALDDAHVCIAAADLAFSSFPSSGLRAAADRVRPDAPSSVQDTAAGTGPP